MICSSIPAHDIKTKSGLNQLYNKKVVSAQAVERPLSGLNGGKIGKFGVGIANSFGIRTSISRKNDRATHSGVLVTTSDGNKYLVHKGDGYGINSQTVVVDANHMRNKWKNVGPSTNVGRKHNIGNYVQAGGKDYRYRGGNCHDATKKMINY